jgi:tetratricopeptide (TPR) repeat protein
MSPTSPDTAGAGAAQVDRHSCTITIVGVHSKDQDPAVAAASGAGGDGGGGGGPLDHAITRFLAYLRDHPDDIRILLKVGDLYAKSGKIQEAVEAYLRAADHFAKEGFFLRAVAVYKQVLKLDPSHTGIWRRLGALYEELGLTSDAEDANRRAEGQPPT